MYAPGATAVERPLGLEVTGFSCFLSGILHTETACSVYFPGDTSPRAVSTCRSRCIGEDFLLYTEEIKSLARFFASLVQTATETLRCQAHQLVDCLQWPFCASVAAPVSCVDGLLL